MIVPVANTLISCLEVFSLGAALAVLAALAASASFGGADSTFGSAAGTSDRAPQTIWGLHGTTYGWQMRAVCCILPVQNVQIPTPTFSGDFGFSGVASLVLDSAVSWEASEACQECKTCWSWKFRHVGVSVFQFSRFEDVWRSSCH
jgi:hypothetical protein